MTDRTLLRPVLYVVLVYLLFWAADAHAAWVTNITAGTTPLQAGGVMMVNPPTLAGTPTNYVDGTNPHLLVHDQGPIRYSFDYTSTDPQTQAVESQAGYNGVTTTVYTGSCNLASGLTGYGSLGEVGISQSQCLNDLKNFWLTVANKPPQTYYYWSGTNAYAGAGNPNNDSLIGTWSADGGSTQVTTGAPADAVAAAIAASSDGGAMVINSLYAMAISTNTAPGTLKADLQPITGMTQDTHGDSIIVGSTGQPLINGNLVTPPAVAEAATFLDANGVAHILTVDSSGNPQVDGVPTTDYTASSLPSVYSPSTGISSPAAGSSVSVDPVSGNKTVTSTKSNADGSQTISSVTYNSSGQVTDATQTTKAAPAPDPGTVKAKADQAAAQGQISGIASGIGTALTNEVGSGAPPPTIQFHIGSHLVWSSDLTPEAAALGISPTFKAVCGLFGFLISLGFTILAITS